MRFRDYLRENNIDHTIEGLIDAAYENWPDENSVLILSDALEERNIPEAEDLRNPRVEHKRLFSYHAITSNILGVDVADGRWLIYCREPYTAYGSEFQPGQWYERSIHQGMTFKYTEANPPYPLRLKALIALRGFERFRFD